MSNNYTNQNTSKFIKDADDPCIDGYACLYRGNPNNDGVNFDNVANAALVIFTMFTMDGWSTVKNMIRDAMHSCMYDSFFLAVVYVGGFFIINLVAAIQFQYYDKLK